MSKKPNLEMIDPDNPEWTDEMFAQSKRIADLPTSLRSKLGVRGPQKTPTKRPTTIRLSPDVVEAFKATGSGWQGRIDAALKDWLQSHPQIHTGA